MGCWRSEFHKKRVWKIKQRRNRAWTSRVGRWRRSGWQNRMAEWIKTSNKRDWYDKSSGQKLATIKCSEKSI